jgi:hypothetical protein
MLESELQSLIALPCVERCPKDVVVIRFDTPAYQKSMAEFAQSVVNGLADIHPVVGQLRRQPTAHAGPTRNVAGPEPLDHSMFRLEQQVAIPDDVIRQSLLDDYGSSLIDIGAQFCEQLTERFVQQMSEVTDAAGNAISAEGRPLSYDLILDALEQVEIDFDEDGNPRMPSVMISPQALALLARIPSTDEQRRRYEEIMTRKKAAHDAQKRHRRLSD